MTTSAPNNEQLSGTETDWHSHWIGVFGSVEEIEQETPEEALLEQALKPFERKVLHTDPRTKEVSTYIEYRGLESEPTDFGKLPVYIVAAVSAAYALPQTLRGVLREYTAWDELGMARDHVCGWAMPMGTIARQLVLEHFLYTLPAQSLDDVSVRVEWWKSRATYEFDLGNEIHLKLAAQLQKDLVALGQNNPASGGET